MSHRIMKNMDDPLSKPIADYLARRYSIPITDIKGVTLESFSGEPQTIMVALYVQKEPTTVAVSLKDKTNAR